MLYSFDFSEGKIGSYMIERVQVLYIRRVREDIRAIQAFSLY